MGTMVNIQPLNKSDALYKKAFKYREDLLENISLHDDAFAVIYKNIKHFYIYKLKP
jgi:hypothetical protein